MNRRKVAVLCIGFFLGWSSSHADLDPPYCVRLMYRKLGIGLPINKEHLVSSEHPSAVHALPDAVEKVFHPEWTVRNLRQQTLSFKILDRSSFVHFTEETRDHGFWVMFNSFNPPETPGIEFGHFSIIVDGMLYSRTIDHGAALSGAAVEKMRDPLVLWDHPSLSESARAPHLIAQFFELDPTATAVLSKFFRRRLAEFGGSKPQYQTRYVSAPFTRDREAKEGESCLSFVYSWTIERWLKLHPELARVKNEVGSFALSDLPVRQLYNNTVAPGYRGTIVVPTDGAEFVKDITELRLHEDRGFVKDLMMAGPGEPVSR